MSDEIKPPAQQQAPAQAAPVVEEKKPDTQQAEPPKPSGLDGIKAEDLKALYSKSPQMFKEAGIVKEEAPPEPKKDEQKPPAPAPQSAAPTVYEGTEIKLPDDVPVNKEVVGRYLAHAKEVGLSPKQVQAEIDFQVRSAREALAAQPKPKSQEEINAELDAANVAKLKADPKFGSKYEQNMEIARRAAAEFADPEVLEMLKTSDPVLVRHFWKLGLKNAEDQTRSGTPRNGLEGDDAEKAAKDQLKARYKNSPQMFE